MLIFAIVFFILLVFAWFSPSRFTAADDLMINELIEVELNGCRQWISVRGSDLNNPVLLFLHGGPGSANIAKLRIQCAELEKHFIVVNWDQRGAGKSYWAWLRGQHPSYDILQKDALSLVNYLRNRFNRQKIYLLGHSWGSVLGLHTIYKNPDDVAAFIAVGQVVNCKQAERLSLAFVQETAQRLNDSKAIDTLNGINPLYEDPDWLNQLLRQRKYLFRYRGCYYSATSMAHEIKMLLKAPEYSLFDCIAWAIGNTKSLEKIWPELMSINMLNDIPRIDVPVHFLVGEHDKITPASLAQEYYNFLQAPKGKELLSFEFSAHDIFYDQPKELIETIIRIKEDLQAQERNL
jgi:pimeloyl-ACP methyl ester carboxylesterase